MTYGEYLIYSARMGDIEGVKECLSEDVPVNTQEEGMGNTALHMACANNFIEVARLLLEHKADINLSNRSKNTALHWAALTGNKDVVKFLIEWNVPEQKVNASLKNEFDRIPLEEALQSQYIDIAEYLAPFSKLDDDKLYSTIHEKQVFLEDVKEEEEVKQEDVSVQSEEAIKNEDGQKEPTSEQKEVFAQKAAEREEAKLEQISQDLKEKLNMGEFNVEVKKTQ